MDDIKRPENPPQRPPYPPVTPPAATPVFTPQGPAPQPIVAATPGLLKTPRRKKTWLWVILGIIGLILVLAAGGLIWYYSQLQPVNKAATERIQVTIESGTAPSAIAQQLKDAQLIRSTEIFALYTRLTDTQNVLQAGSYHLSQSETLPEIVDHLVDGKVDSFDITFLPGATLAQNRKVLIDAGYDAADVDAALAKTYSSPLFQDKPAGSDLEGYIYGETYRISSGATVEDILALTFAEYASVIEENNLVAGFAAQRLTLYQGITLASIIQREAIGGDEPQIAQVFFTRLAMDMELGSDVTYQYIADKTGVARDPNLDSPYNTRRYAGLPPGPISAPGLAALKAVATPAAGDYVYFLSGDDDVTYFAHTFEEHQANIANHCQQKCQIL